MRDMRKEGAGAYVRDVRLEDAVHLLNIYDYYVRETAVSFEWETPSLEEFVGRMKHIRERYPYLVAVDRGAVAGYAYAQPFVERTAYDWTCELTIYLDPQVRRRGLGRLLYEALEQRLRAMGILDLYACIGVPHVEGRIKLNPTGSHALDDPHLSWDSPRFFRAWNS